MQQMVLSSPITIINIQPSFLLQLTYKMIHFHQIITKFLIIDGIVQLLSAFKIFADKLYSIHLGELKLGEFVILNGSVLLQFIEPGSTYLAIPGVVISDMS